MTLVGLIINTYRLVDDYLKEASLFRLRKRGEPPFLSDRRVTTCNLK